MSGVVRWLVGFILIGMLFFILRLGLGIARLHFFGSSGGEVDSAAAEVYRAAAEQFGVAVVEQNWPEAYAMMATDYRQRRPLEKFVAVMKSAEAEFVAEGRALTAMAGVNAFGSEMNDPDFAETYDIPADVPKSPPWKAYVVNDMVLELDEDGDTERCYSMGTLMVDEADGPKVAHLEYWWCD